jgi:hypothetical protein
MSGQFLFFGYEADCDVPNKSIHGLTKLAETFNDLFAKAQGESSQNIRY